MGFGLKCKFGVHNAGRPGDGRPGDGFDGECLVVAIEGIEFFLDSLPPLIGLWTVEGSSDGRSMLKDRLLAAKLKRAALQVAEAELREIENLMNTRNVDIGVHIDKSKRYEFCCLIRLV